MSEPSENPTFKLYYFNLTALGEPIRILFAYGGIEYDDVRICAAEWPELKPTWPMGQLPVLEIDGQQVHQSNAINRYLAKRVGLAGENDWENLLIDIAVDTIHDFRTKIAVAYYETDEAVKETKMENVKKNIIPFYSEKLEEMAKENDGYFALGRLTWADILFVGLIEYMSAIVGFDLIADYPSLQQVVANVKSVESIAEWFEKRPKTEL